MADPVENIQSEEQILEPQEQTTDTEQALVDDLKQMADEFEQSFQAIQGEQNESGKEGDETDSSVKDSEKQEETPAEPEFDITTLTVKHNGEDVPLSNVLKELKASQPEQFEEIKADLRKRFDYTKKTQSLSEERKQFESEKQKAEEVYKYVYLENLANEVGGKPIPFEHFYNTKDENGEYKYSDEDTAKKDYDNYLQDRKTKELTVEQNRKSAAEKNQQITQAFEDKYGVTVDQAFMNELGKYVNPSVTKQQMPFPDDTLEVFYKGKNFDKLVEIERQKAKDEVLKEIESKRKSKAVPDAPTTQKVPTSKANDSEMDRAFDLYLNRR